MREVKWEVERRTERFWQRVCQGDVRRINFVKANCFYLVYIAPSWFPWCGLLLNTKTLEVASDCTRLFSQGAHAWKGN